MDKPVNGGISHNVVVVVDDDPAVRNSLKFSLEIEGFVVHLYESGSDLLKEKALPHCSCFVIDQQMPGIPGLDLIIRLRDQSVSTPAILITSRPNPALARRAADANIPIVEKPLLTDSLVELIRKACAPRQQA
jgi:FixJ family two-component response regulator